jgi:hypothetical protein
LTVVPVSGVRRLSLGVGLGTVTGLVVGIGADSPLGVLVGIATAGISAVLAGWMVSCPMDAIATRANVERENARPVFEESIIALATWSKNPGDVVTSSCARCNARRYAVSGWQGALAIVPDVAEGQRWDGVRAGPPGGDAVIGFAVGSGRHRRS